LHFTGGKMDLKLDGKKALVTGASRGLGYATAKALATDGCAVVINSRNEANINAAAGRLISETGAAVFGLAGDLSDPSVPELLVKTAAEKLGGLDILICNAGGPPPGLFESFEEATWQRAIDLSFMSNVRLIKAALPYLRKSDFASVLTITSFSVKQPIANLILSNSIRGATIGLTKSLALELGNEGIRFNSILPAWTQTERVQELMVARAKVNGTTMEEEIAKLSRESPLGRIGQPEEFANAAVFLVSPAASYITGIMLSVDGGMYKATI
jgi:3-oxoacyl-[acyl-carrier protein] reductase